MARSFQVKKDGRLELSAFGINNCQTENDGKMKFVRISITEKVSKNIATQLKAPLRHITRPMHSSVNIKDYLSPSMTTDSIKPEVTHVDLRRWK